MHAISIKCFFMQEINLGGKITNQTAIFTTYNRETLNSLKFLYT